MPEFEVAVRQDGADMRTIKAAEKPVQKLSGDPWPRPLMQSPSLGKSDRLGHAREPLHITDTERFAHSEGKYGLQDWRARQEVKTSGLQTLIFLWAATPPHCQACRCGIVTKVERCGGVEGRLLPSNAMLP